MAEILIIGGGVIGLSLAFELAQRGRTAHLLDRGELGRQASWAGAGILPPAARRDGQHPYEALAALSRETHDRWATQLGDETGIDTGYRRCGGLYLARTAGEAAALRGLQAQWSEEGLELQRLDAGQVFAWEPDLRPAGQQAWPVRAAYHAPQEARVRNPRHLAALVAACRHRGVELTPHCEAATLLHAGDRMRGVLTATGERIEAELVCICGGAWSGQLIRQLNVASGVLPIRGQMVLFGPGSVRLRRVINDGSRYLVPRDDGRLLAGSTEEEAGFDSRTTDEGIAGLLQYARQLIPHLCTASPERVWAGLRPGTLDGFPYLGRFPGYRNAYVAAGHFRSGILLSPATAIVMADLIEGREPELDLTPFRVGRG